MPTTIDIGTTNSVLIGSNAGNIQFYNPPQTMSDGFFLYFPVTVTGGATATIKNGPEIVENPTLGAPLMPPATTPPQSIYYDNITATDASQLKSFILTNSVDVTGPGTLYFPYNSMLPTSVDVAAIARDFSTRVFPASDALASGAAAAPLTPGTTAALISSTSRTTAAPVPSTPGTTTAPVPSASGTATASVSSASSTAAAASNSRQVSAGALAGGIVGAFAGALLLAALIWLLFGRRSRAGRGANVLSPRRQSGDDTSCDDTQVPLKSIASVGWEKHLPQEKDDKALTSAIKSIFDHVMMNLEAYYSARAQSHSTHGVESLERYPCDNLSQLLVRTENNLPLLEGIVLRWIVRRISLRAPVAESFLPREYTSIPGDIKWHMEHDGLGESFPSESRKGFSEAFSKWRVLTGFLYPDLAKDKVYRTELEAIIQSSAQTLSDALAPWAIPGKSDKNRTESWRQILYSASDAGLLLFTQPATFTFDWSNDQREEGQGVVISPALVIKPDARKGPMQLPPVLLEAKRINLTII